MLHFTSAGRGQPYSLNEVRIIKTFHPSLFPFLTFFPFQYLFYGGDTYAHGVLGSYALYWHFLKWKLFTVRCSETFVFALRSRVHLSSFFKNFYMIGATLIRCLGCEKMITTCAFIFANRLVECLSRSERLCSFIAYYNVYIT